MFLSKLIFLNFLCGLSARPNDYSYARWPVPDAGVNNTCGKNIRITALTVPVCVGQDPHWDEDCRSVLYANEQSPATGVHRYAIDTKKHYWVNLESQGCGRVSTPLPIKDAPGKYFFACNDNLSILSWDGKNTTASFRNVIRPVPENGWPAYNVRGGKVAPSGALLIFSDPSTLPKTATNAVLLAIVNGKPKTLVKGFAFGTGLGFSCDGQWLYFSDLIRKYLYKGRYNPKTDSVESLRVLLDFAKIPSLHQPSSLTVDSENNVWVACYQGGLVIKVDPYSGEVICSVKLPVEELTNVVFGRCPNGEYGSMNCMYATSMETSTNRPTGGSLFLVEGLDAAGTPPFWLRLNTVVSNREQYSGR